MKGKPFGGAPLGLNDGGCASPVVLEQLACESFQLGGSPAFATKLGERDSFNRAIAANANRS
ncbi:MAG TPA: hypothetical protein VGW97_00255, partial [Chthoniobacterales bacterium]|nr:hypothetical protein [Chthoniobacterales bacterium]